MFLLLRLIEQNFLLKNISLKIIHKKSLNNKWVSSSGRNSAGNAPGGQSHAPWRSVWTRSSATGAETTAVYSIKVLEVNLTNPN